MASGIENRFSIEFAALLAQREKQIQQSYRPVIGIHKWFARRPGSVFRNLMLSEFVADKSVESAYWSGHRLGGVIADPFMGGGTPIYEADRLGFSVVGTDVNPMSYWIVRQSLVPLDISRFTTLAEDVVRRVEEEIYSLYQTRCVECGYPAEVKYFLWVKTQECPACGTLNDLFPGYLLAEAIRHPRHVLVCSHCGHLNECEHQPTLASPAHCEFCEQLIYVEGPARRNKIKCRNCSVTFAYPGTQPNNPPSHRMWAIEYHCRRCKDGHKGRFFKQPDENDLLQYEQAVNQLALRRHSLLIPSENIPDGDETRRLHRWGYRFYYEMFNSRQLLGLGTLLKQILVVECREARDALLTVFSDFLRYQNMLCRYDTYALKCQDIFSVHGFPVGLIQCEDNLLGVPKVGSGAFRHFVEKYVRAKEYCQTPFEVSITGRQKKAIAIDGERIEAELVEAFPTSPEGQAWLLPATATTPALPKESLDGVFTDPPYYDNVQYAELIDFCFVWLRMGLKDEIAAFRPATTRTMSELTGNDSMGRGLVHFAEGLSRVFQHYASALKHESPFVFTYHHNDPRAYVPIVVAVLDARLDCTASLPTPGEMEASLHISGTTSSVLDSVFVCRKVRTEKLEVHLTAQVKSELQGLLNSGLKVSAGDIRCVIAGHFARIAINRLCSEWPSEASLLERMELAAKTLTEIQESHPTIEFDLLAFLSADQKTEQELVVPRPFELDASQLTSQLEEMVDQVFFDLVSETLVLPKGNNFIKYADFRDAYEVLKRHTYNFTVVSISTISSALLENSRTFGVWRAILGMTAPEWAELVRNETGIDIPQGAARQIDRYCRASADYVRKLATTYGGDLLALLDSGTEPVEGLTLYRVLLLIHVGAQIVAGGAPPTSEELVHRLDKFDTTVGIESLQYAASEGVPYAVLLYERYLGRPFAGHRDSVSELVGDVMENAIEMLLRDAGITYRKTKRAEKIPNFGQAPDFCIPDEISPIAVIEAKITSDDGTARDKVARIMRLVTQRDEHVKAGWKPYEVIACIDGRGFRIRREIMRQLLESLEGKVFTSATLDKLLTNTRVHELASRNGQTK